MIIINYYYHIAARVCRTLVEADGMPTEQTMIRVRINLVIIVLWP